MSIMAKRKSSKSIHFVDLDGVGRFLFQVVTIADGSDYLKFAFNSTQSSKVIYTEPGSTYIDDSLLRSYGEISYKADGALLIKFPENSQDPKVYKNPDGKDATRKPLKEISDWEPLFVGKIIRYQDCIDGKTDDIVEFPRNDELFNGDPFEYVVYLGNCRNVDLPKSYEAGTSLRLSMIAEELDLLVLVSKSNYRGFPFQFGSIKGWNNNNVVQVIDPLTGKTTDHLLNMAIYRTAAKITPHTGNIIDENKDPEFKVSLKAATGRDSKIARPTPDPYSINVYRVSSGYLIEVRPRAGVWFPFSIAVPHDEREKVGGQRPVFSVGAPDKPPSLLGTLILFWDGVGGGTDRDGAQWWMMNPAGDVTPEKSFYLFVRDIPSLIAFGPRKGPQYTYRLLPLERPPIRT